jgi:hypothetical protein
LIRGDSRPLLGGENGCNLRGQYPVDNGSAADKKGPNCGTGARGDGFVARSERQTLLAQPALLEAQFTFPTNAKMHLNFSAKAI